MNDSPAPLSVALGARSYPIHIGVGFVADAELQRAFWKKLLDASGAGRDIALVTNTTVGPLYGHRLQAALEAAGKRVVAIVVPDGEAHKDAATLAIIHDAMLEARFDRGVTVVALGGGVVGDLAGFAAATYQRGVRYVQAPTTLLAQVDSSVGGKTGINHRLGKNMIGAFHQPHAVVVDIATLATLSDRELSAGLAEVIKYGASLDADFFSWLETAMPALRARDRAALSHAIQRSCTLKAQIVAEDERESGRRALLNFGHTFGHAIEGATGYGAWLHGEAVGAGMILAARLSHRLGLIETDVIERLTSLIAAAGLPTEAPDLDVSTWLHWMASDKKADAGQLRFVLLDALGRARLAKVPDDALNAVLRAKSNLGDKRRNPIVIPAAPASPSP